MVENLSSVPDFITNPELEKRIINGSITTFTITEEFLPYYTKAAGKTGYEVTVIAKPGEYYVTEEIKPVNRRRGTSLQNNPPIINCVKSKSSVRERSVAISLKRPESITNDMAFHIARQKIQPV